MALSGLHITYGYAGSQGKVTMYQTVQPILRVFSSETMSSAGTSNTSAPAFDSNFGEPVVRLRSSADIWVSFGTSPNANTGPRVFIANGTDYDFAISPGSKIDWVLA